MNKIVVLNDWNQGQREKLEALLPDNYAVSFTNEKMAIIDADIIIGNPPISLLKERTKKLAWLQLASAGYEKYTNNVLEGAILTNASGVYGPTIGEHVVGQLLVLMRDFHTYVKQQDKKIWQATGQISAISKSRILIVGTGDLGKNIATRLTALGGEVIGVNRSGHRALGFSKTISLSELDNYLPNVDVIVLCLPGSIENQNFIDYNRLQLMKKTAYLVNVGRGSLINEVSLIAFLKENTQFKAALDVFQDEPLSADSELWSLPNVFITPHVAGGFHLPATFQRFVDLSISNLTKFMNNERMDNIISH